MAVTDVDFDARVDALPSDRAKASEMEHALRHHITENFDLDPELYGGFAERLERIISAMDENWDETVRDLRRLKAEVLTGRRDDDGSGLDPELKPFYAMLAEQMETRLDHRCRSSGKAEASCEVGLRRRSTKPAGPGLCIPAMTAATPGNGQWVLFCS